MNAWRIALWVAIVISLLAFLWLVRAVLPPFILALVTAIMLEPAVRRLRKVGVSRPLAVVAVLTSFFVVLTALIWLSAPYVSQQYTQAKNQIQTLYDTLSSTDPDEAMVTFDGFLAKNKATLEQFGLATTRRDILRQYVDPNREMIQRQTQKFITGGVVSILSVATQLFMLSLTPILVFGLLVDLENMRKAVARFIPPTIRKPTLSLMGDIGRVFEGYLRGLVTNVLLYTLVIGLMLAGLGTPYFLVLACLAGLLYLIPIVGGVLSSIVMFLVVGLSGATQGTFFQAENSWVFGLYVVIGMFIVGTLYDAIVTPRIVGRSVKLNAIVSAFVVFSAGALFGLPGMLLAYPVAGAIKVVLDRLVKFTTASDVDLRLPAVPLRHRQATLT